MIDVIVDIETLGTGERGQDVTVIQLAAAVFNRYTGEILEEFNHILRPNFANNFNVEPKTLKFWLEEEPKLLLELMENGDGDETYMFESFIKWLSNICSEYKKVNPDFREIHFTKMFRLWGFGAMFDNRIIRENILKHTNYDYPIYHTNDRDIHTILDLACEKSGRSRKEVKEMAMLRNLKKHNALDDVRYQANLVATCLKLLDIE